MKKKTFPDIKILDFVEILGISNCFGTSLFSNDNSVRRLYQPSRLKRVGEEKILSQPHIVSYKNTKYKNSFGFRVEVDGWGEYIMTSGEINLYMSKNDL